MLLQARADSVTTTTHTSWLQQIQDSLWGVLVGLALFALSFPLLVWNECKAARIYRILTAAQNACVKNVSADAISPKNEGRLVHVVAQCSTAMALQDRLLNLTLPN